MSDLLSAPLPAPATFEDWFGRLADWLLQEVRLVAGGEPHRIIEVEFYYQDDDAHIDPFAHAQPIQRSSGRWYFHSDGGQFRGGSFKGLDITFGPPHAFGGILIRTLQRPDGAFINGSSLCVDHLLRSTHHPSVASLAAEVGERGVLDPTNPLSLQELEGPDNGPTIWRTARVGLTLKRANSHPEMPAYLFKAYRYLTEPRAVKKGRIYHIIALHEAGISAEAIRATTGSPKRTIEKYIQLYEAGRKRESLLPWFGEPLRSVDRCEMLGAWRTIFGT